MEGTVDHATSHQIQHRTSQRNSAFREGRQQLRKKEDFVVPRGPRHAHEISNIVEFKGVNHLLHPSEGWRTAHEYKMVMAEYSAYTHAQKVSSSYFSLWTFAIECCY